jgi:hypothetical protein
MPRSWKTWLKSLILVWVEGVDVQVHCWDRLHTASLAESPTEADFELEVGRWRRKRSHI